MSDTVKRQLEIPAEAHNQAEIQQLQEKQETGKKRPLYEILVEYVVAGANLAKQRASSSTDITPATVVDDREVEDERVWNEVAKADALLSLSKKNLPKFKEKITNAVEMGNADPVEVIARIAAFEKIFVGDSRNPGVKKMLMDSAIDEIEKNGGKIQIGNFEITAAETGVKYDYSSDPVWNELNENLTLEKEKLKNRELFLKGVKAPDPVKGIEPQTELVGDEVIELRPPVKTSTTSTKISLK